MVNLKDKLAAYIEDQIDTTKCAIRWYKNGTIDLSCARTFFNDVCNLLKSFDYPCPTEFKQYAKDLCIDTFTPNEGLNPYNLQG